MLTAHENSFYSYNAKSVFDLCNAVQLASYFRVKQFAIHLQWKFLNSQPRQMKKPKQRDTQTAAVLQQDFPTCVCKRAADNGLVTGATASPPCKTCSQPKHQEQSSTSPRHKDQPCCLSSAAARLIVTSLTQAE